MTSSGPATALEPFLDEPAAAALLFDLDGTLAPIVARPDQARVPDRVRAALARIAGRYALAAVVSGRRAADARAIVGLEKLTYVGNHGFELLLPGAPAARPAPELGDRGGDAAAFAAAIDRSVLDRAGLRFEDKGPIVALHWRGAADEGGAEAEAERIATDATGAGLTVHRGRKVLELRPPGAVDKGTAIESLLMASDLSAALYAGDDRTDLDGFAALDRLADAGRLRVALRIGVVSAEGPKEIAARADLTVAGPAELVPMLVALAG
ncbi:MAG TPA: trehalose-phosphatase [Solirubrobacterales bacterium]|nr:trehalose-phosphatase [Solirubrobacterales bacterium]